MTLQAAVRTRSAAASCCFARSRSASILLLLWQGASGRLVDNFFISNPVDVGTRLARLDHRRLDLRAYLGDGLRHR